MCGSKPKIDVEFCTVGLQPIFFREFRMVPYRDLKCACCNGTVFIVTDGKLRCTLCGVPSQSQDMPSELAAGGTSFMRRQPQETD
jgi:hypothetical protein